MLVKYIKSLKQNHRSPISIDIHTIIVLYRDKLYNLQHEAAKAWRYRSQKGLYRKTYYIDSFLVFSFCKVFYYIQYLSKGGKKMCEANAYLVKDGEEKLIMESVDTLRPEKNGLYLQDIFGNQEIIKAKIKEMKLVDHRILLEEEE